MKSYNSRKRQASGFVAYFFGAILLSFFSAATASGNYIYADLKLVPGTSDQYEGASLSIADIEATDGLVIGDKLFNYFNVTTSPVSTISAPDASHITITPVEVKGDYGFRVNSYWSAYAGQMDDSTIRFKASILPEYVAMGYAFTDTALYFTSVGARNTKSGSASITETLYKDFPASGPSFANNYVYYVSDTDNYLKDTATFVAPITSMWILKDVGVNLTDDATGSISISEFYQTFSQVPEPGTLAMLCIGAIGLAGFALRRRLLGDFVTRPQLTSPYKTANPVVPGLPFLLGNDPPACSDDGRLRRRRTI